MRPSAAREFAGTAGIARLMAGVLIPPVAWGLHLQTSYIVATEACDGGWITHVATLVALGLVAVAAALTWRNVRTLWHRTGDVADAVGGGAPATIGRSRFLTVAGAGSILFFTLLILAGEVPNWFFDPCF